MVGQSAASLAAAELGGAGGERPLAVGARKLSARLQGRRATRPTINSKSSGPLACTCPLTNLRNSELSAARRSRFLAGGQLGARVPARAIDFWPKSSHISCQRSHFSLRASASLTRAEESRGNR